jgi:gluconate kinase
MLVEFIGESGCGKSTLVRFIAENDSGIKVRTYTSNKEIILTFVINLRFKEYRKLFKSIYALSLKTYKNKRIIKNALYLIQLLNLLFGDIDNNKEILFLEQGLVQFIYSIYFYTEPNNDEYKLILEELCKNFKIYFVFCRCSYNILISRINKRKNNFMEDKRRIEDIIDNPKYIEHHDKIFTMILNEIPDERIICVDTSKELSYNNKIICEWIRRQYAQ